MIETDALGSGPIDIRRNNLIVAVTSQHVRRLLITEYENQVRLGSLSGCLPTLLKCTVTQSFPPDVNNSVIDI